MPRINDLSKFASKANGVYSSVTTNATAITGIYANGTLGTNGQFLTSNGTGVYWGSTTGPTQQIFTYSPGYTGTTARANRITTATYSQAASNTVTVTANGHNLAVGDQVYLDFTSGTATDSWFSVNTAPTTNTFTIVRTANTTTSGNVTVYPPIVVTANGHGLVSGNTYLVFSNTFNAGYWQLYQITSNTFQIRSNTIGGYGNSGITATFKQFSVSNTWTKPTGCKKILVELVGAGGIPTTGAGLTAGSAGGYAQKLINVESVSTVSITFGPPGFSSNTLFNVGGNTSFGVYLSATGGGETYSPGTGANGDIILEGQSGNEGVSGSTKYGYGVIISGGSVLRKDASGYGSGGAFVNDGLGGYIDYEAKGGIIIVTEYY